MKKILSYFVPRNEFQMLNSKRDKPLTFDHDMFEYLDKIEKQCYLADTELLSSTTSVVLR